MRSRGLLSLHHVRVALVRLQEHVDYDLVEAVTPAALGSTNPGGRAIVRINVYRAHRQTVQYIAPQHQAKLAQAELLVIDEAAAIPLPVVKVRPPSPDVLGSGASS